MMNFVMGSWDYFVIVLLDMEMYMYEISPVCTSLNYEIFQLQ